MSKSRIPRLLAIVTFGALVAGACGNNPSPPKVDCATVAVVRRYGELTIWPTCTSCHDTNLLSSTARHDAPAGVNYDTHEAAKASAMSAAAQVNAGAMPPSGYPQPTEDQKTALYNWALCGTP